MIRIVDKFIPLFDWSKSRTVLNLGGYGSGKSHSTAMAIVLELATNKRKCLVVRQVNNTHKESTYDLLQEFIKENGVKAKCIKSPLEINFDNGSRIIFRGMDDPSKIKSITDISVIWVEECTEINKDSYLELRGRLRSPHTTNHFLLTCNPVSKHNWVYKEFFTHVEGKEHKNLTIIRSNIYDNPFVAPEYIATLENLKYTDEYLYNVACLGEFGELGLRVLNNLRLIDDNSIPHHLEDLCGMDFGFKTSKNCTVRVKVDRANNNLYVCDVEESKMLINEQIAESIERFRPYRIFGDCAEPKTIEDLRRRGFNIISCKKWTILEHLKKVHSFYNIFIPNSLAKYFEELDTLTFKKDLKTGEIDEEKFNFDCHLLDAIIYALTNYKTNSLKLGGI
jgi:phage terminase large subunit